MFMEHVKMLAGDNADYLLTWLAHLFQKPGEKTGVCVTLQGGQGSGKGVLIEETIGPLIGDRHYAYTNDPNSLLAKHSELRNGRILVILDDFDNKAMHACGQPLKSIVTSKKTTYEKKNVQEVMLTNLMNVICMTNKSNPVRVEGDDRRNAIIPCCDILIGNVDYFNRYNAYIANQTNQRAIYDYLMAYDISKINLRAQRPQSQMYADMKRQTADPVLLFFEYSLTYAESPLRLSWEEASPNCNGNASMDDAWRGAEWQIDGSTVYKHYTRWWGDQNFNMKKTVLARPAFGMKLRGLFKTDDAGLKIDQNNGNGSKYKFKNRELMVSVRRWLPSE
jgi:hypothetical protein